MGGCGGMWGCGDGGQGPGGGGIFHDVDFY